jgi:hypothetical protein
MSTTRINKTTVRHNETGAIVYRTPRKWYVAVETGMPTDSARVGEGDSISDAVAALFRTAIQGNHKRDALEWVSFQNGAGFRVVDDKRFMCGFRLVDAD